MPSRAELELRAASVNVTSANYKSDSSLEQAVIYAEQNGVVQAGNGTRQAAPADAIRRVSGGKNV